MTAELTAPVGEEEPQRPDHRDLTRADEHLADLLAEDGPFGLAQRVRYSRATRGWYTWRRFYWSNDEAHAYALVASCARHLLATFGQSPARARAILPLLDVRKQRSVLEALSHRENFRLQGDEFDQVPHLVAVQNGVVDLRSGTFSLEGRPEDYITKRARVRWDPEARTELFLPFLRQIMSNDEERAVYLASVLGYSLFGHQREQKFWLFVGKGQNGKGTLMKTLHWMLGDYSTWPDASLYMRSKHGEPSARDGNPAFLDLQGVRFTPMSEPSGGTFNDELLKAHTGDDPIRARALYSNDYVEFRPTHTIVLATNTAPRVSDVGLSMRRRVRVIDFREDYTDPAVEDKDLERKLKAEAPGIFQLLVRLAARYNELGMLEPEPADVTEASSAYIEANDALADFLADRCVVAKQEQASSESLWLAYEEWRKAEPDRPMMARNDFGAALGKRFVLRRVGQKKTRMYGGVRLANAVELADREA